jgi:hypothetical protein
LLFAKGFEIERAIKNYEYTLVFVIADDDDCNIHAEKFKLIQIEHAFAKMQTNVFERKHAFKFMCIKNS